MSKIIRRFGTKPVKFEFVIAFEEVKMSVDLEGVMLIRWVRGPRTATSMEAEGKHGLFKWKKEDQGRRPTRMICTLYKNRGLGEYQKKKSLLVVKQKIGDTMLTVGEVELDLANFVAGSGESSSRAMNEAIHKCSDKKARVKFTITSRDVTKQHVDMGNEVEVSGLTGGLDDDNEDYFDPDGRADFADLELAGGEDEGDEEGEPEEKPPEDQGTISLVPKPQVLSFVSSDVPDASPAAALSVVVPKMEPPKSSADDAAKIRELDTTVWQLKKKLTKVDKELITARDQYAKHLEQLEHDLATTTTKFEAKEKLATELSHKLEATLVDLEMETVRVRSFARILDMQRSQIEAAEAEAATFQARAGELQNRLTTTESSLRVLTEQKPGMMAQLTSSKRVKELEELVVAKDQSIKFYEAQLESSDKTMLAAKESWDNSSRLLLQEISSAESSFKKTKQLLEEATSEAGHFSDVERQFKRAIADRLKMSELLTQYECSIAQKDMELQQLQLQLATKDGTKYPQYVQSRESSLRSGMDQCSPAISPTAFPRNGTDDFKHASSSNSLLTLPHFALGTSSSNLMSSEESTTPSSTVIHLGPLTSSSSLSSSHATTSSASSSSSNPFSPPPSLNPFASTSASATASSLNSYSALSSSPLNPFASTESVSSDNATNPFDLSTNPFDSPKHDSPVSSSSTSTTTSAISPSSNPFDSLASETIPTITITTNSPVAATTVATSSLPTASPSLTSSLSSSFSSLFKKTSKASSTAGAVAAAVSSSSTSTTGTSPSLSSSASPSFSPNFLSSSPNSSASLSPNLLASTPNFSSSLVPTTPNFSASESAFSPPHSEPIPIASSNPPVLSLSSQSPSPHSASFNPFDDESKSNQAEFPPRASSTGMLRHPFDSVRPTDLPRSVSSGTSEERRKRSDDFGRSTGLARSTSDNDMSVPTANTGSPPADLTRSPRSSRSLGIFFATSEGNTAPVSLAEVSRSPRWGMSRGLLFSSTEPAKNFDLLPTAELIASTAGSRSLESILERDDLSPGEKNSIVSHSALPQVDSEPVVADSDFSNKQIRSNSDSDERPKAVISPTAVSSQRDTSPAPSHFIFASASSSSSATAPSARRLSGGSKASKRPPPPPTVPITSIASLPGVEILVLPQSNKDEPFEEF